MPLDKEAIEFEVAQSSLLRRRLVQGELLTSNPLDRKYRSTYTLLGSSMTSLQKTYLEIPDGRVFLRRKASGSGQHHHSAIYFYELCSTNGSLTYQCWIFSEQKERLKSMMHMPLHLPIRGWQKRSTSETLKNGK